MLKYRVVLEEDTNGTFLATCPDFPEVAAVGDTEQEAIQESYDAIQTAIIGRIGDRLPIPVPGIPEAGQLAVTMNGQVTLKAFLHNEMLKNHVRKTDLAGMLGQHPPQIDRLLDPRHNSKLEALEAAFAALGKNLEVKVA